jgi:flagella basal body P-ring formation protein FlgA
MHGSVTHVKRDGGRTIAGRGQRARPALASRAAGACHCLSENRRIAGKNRWHEVCFIQPMKMNADQRRLLGAIAATALMLCRPGHAGDAAASLEAIRQAAEQAVLSHSAPAGARLSANAATLDPRLQLAPCASALRGALAGDGELHDTVTVAVRCEQPVRWTVYVRVSVNTELPVLTARHLLPRGSALSAADFEFRPRLVNGLGSRYPTGPEALAGARLRLPLNAGDVLSNDMLEQLPLIRRGQQVTLMARSGTVEIRVNATALADGRAEQRIQVQNQNSRQIVEAVVRRSDLVEVPL